MKILLKIRVKHLLMTGGALFLVWLLWPLFFQNIGALKTRTPKTTKLMEIRRDQAKRRGEKFRPVHTWVPLEQISLHLQKAVLAAEDDGFYQHGGVEWGLMKDAFLYDLKKGKWSRGASTITQQLTKNLYLDPSKNPFRKLKEMVITFHLEKVLSKRRILELYLNFAEWGDGIFGAEAASGFYFHKSAADLTWEEAISLAAILPSPLKNSPLDHSRWIEMRKAWLRQRLWDNYQMPVPDDSSKEPTV